MDQVCKFVCKNFISPKKKINFGYYRGQSGLWHPSHPEKVCKICPKSQFTHPFENLHTFYTPKNSPKILVKVKNVQIYPK